MEGFISLFQAAVFFGTVIMFGCVGEIITEKAGNLNLGVPGIMYLGGISSLVAVFLYDAEALVDKVLLFIGYIFMRKVRVASFYAGFEISEIWTKSNRNYSFLLMGKDETKRFSILIGPKIGWVVPLTEKRKIQTLYRY